MRIYTIGHSTRSADQLLALLAEREVEVLADVRAYPSSRRHPHFARDAMREWLSRAGVRYAHFPGLGGRRAPVLGSPNGGWQEPAFRGYADYMATAEFQGALADLEAVAREAQLAIMCAEAVWWRCHRRLIADALVVRGWRVEHLGVGDKPAVHELTPFAVLDAAGAITYPPAQTTLLGAPERLSERVYLAEYDPGWPDRYAHEAARVRRALGARVQRLEHVGSTSVPGLTAKPIIDIVLEVPDSAHEPAYVPDLVQSGYTLRIREPEWFEHRLLRPPDRTVHLHVFSAGCPETDRMVRFRDHLRADAADRALYEQCKRELATREWTYMQQYADAKTEVIATIMGRIDHLR
jgi:GrpB-like predicted nucleotidyltransferase (UPF0157 family)